MTIDPKKISQQQRHAFLLSSVAPRPICFASTLSKHGEVNLSPYSFFNVFSSNPPILVFSPARRGRDHSTKDTLDNILETKEVVINIVNYPIVEQMSLSSTEYDKGVNEFIKSGLTEVPSEMVAPPRVKEAPVSFECKVNEVISLGDEGGAGNLVICEVVLMHFQDHILKADGDIPDTHKLDLVARMGENWYCRATESAIFEIPKPLKTKGIGVDQLPENVRSSEILTGNDLGRLGNVESLPTHTEIQQIRLDPEVVTASQKGEQAIHKLAKRWLTEGRTRDALACLFIPH